MRIYIGGRYVGRAGETETWDKGWIELIRHIVEAGNACWWPRSHCILPCGCRCDL
jgi:hypothetical protein